MNIITGKFCETKEGSMLVADLKESISLKWRGKSYIILCDGELFNADEVRGQLLTLGHNFKTISTAELILHSYVEWGDKCLTQFNGVFAFVIFCKQQNKLFFARDCIGVKPFFYAVKKGELLFASQIKHLFDLGIKPVMDKNSVSNIIMLGPGRVQGCGVYAGIKELKPAEYGYFSGGKITKTKYWKMRAKNHTDSFEDTVFNVRTLTVDAIKRQLVTDKPLGVFLSGGLDSSIIASVASKVFDKPIQTFSLDYEGNDKHFIPGKFQPSNDSNYVDIMNDYIRGVSHKTKLETETLADSIYDAADARDLPGMADIDSSLLLFCKDVKRHVNVAMSGECSDEIFGGYPWFTNPEIKARAGFPWAQNTAERFAFLNKHWQNKIDGEKFVNTLYQKTLKDIHVQRGATQDERRAKEMIMLNFDWFMQTLLDRSDRMAGFSGIEVRVPYCDYRIAEYLYNVPWEYKYHNNTEKGLLREAFKEYLPPQILSRKKSPFPKTYNPLYLSLIKQKLQDIINCPYSRIFEVVDRAALEKLMQATDFKFYGQLMNVPQTMAYFVQMEYLLKKLDVVFKE